MSRFEKHLARALPALVWVAVCATGAAAEEPGTRWRWTAFEIVGQVTTDRDAVAAAIPLPVGEPLQEDGTPWVGWCAGLAAKLDLRAASCAPVWMFDGRAYLVVEIVERAEAARAEFAPAPTGDVALDPELVALHERLEERFHENFRAGREMPERAEAGYLDYGEPVMHEIAAALLEKVPQHKATLLRAIAEDRDADDRARAATLLHWAPDKEASIAAVHGHLDDPSSLVRNNISRFMLFYLSSVKSDEVRRAVVPSLARQLARPSHGDRNKALFCLKALLDGSPALAPLIREAAGPWIDRIAEQSVLENVGGVARELAAALEPPPPPPPPPKPEG